MGYFPTHGFWPQLWSVGAAAAAHPALCRTYLGLHVLCSGVTGLCAFLSLFVSLIATNNKMWGLPDPEAEGRGQSSVARRSFAKAEDGVKSFYGVQ